MTCNEYTVKDSLAFKRILYYFNGNLYKQVNGIAMGSPLGPMLANAFPV